MNDRGPSLNVESAHPWLSGTLTDEPMLIIGGGYRCGTTSLFSYLAGHPEISPSLIKEPCFFFSMRLAQQPSAYPSGHEAWAYRSMFRKKGARVLMEGTSNYLNDPGCAARIKRALPNARVVLLLREPVARLVSWYKFLRLQNQLDPGMTFEDWIRRQLDDPRPVDERPYPLQAVEHCRYSRYVDEYLRVLGPERVIVLWFDDLKRDPRATTQQVCDFAGVAPEYFDDYQFSTRNESMKIARPRLFAAYRKLHRGVFRLLRPWPRLQHELKVQLFGVVEPRLLPLFAGPANPVHVPEHLARTLRRCLRDDLAPLGSLTGMEVPWQAAYLEV